MIKKACEVLIQLQIQFSPWACKTSASNSVCVFFLPDMVTFLKLNIQKTKIMASGPITSWQIDRETVADFTFLGSKITADCDCSPEIKRCLIFGRKVMTNLDSILKSRDITLSTKVHLVKAMVFPLVINGCESWTIKESQVPKN